MLKDVKTPSNEDDEGISCSKAEAIMELEEGGAEYVGTGTLLNNQLMSANQLVDYFSTLLSNGPNSSPFYDFGLMQMLLISAIKGVNMNDVTARIQESTTWENGIGGEFKKYWGPK